MLNVVGKTTAVMQSPAFVETLNTNAGLDDDSGIWQYCEGNYPILVSEGTCEEFYSKYGLSSSSQSSSSSVESSSSSPVESSSSSSDVILSSSEESSSCSVIASSSSDESSSSKAETSSSAKSESSSSSKVNSSSSKGTDIVWNAVQPTFNLAVNGMTLTLSNTQGGVVRIFDALGHMVAAKPLAGATTSITLQTPGNYIVRVNGISRSVTLK
ncbi:MAG: T9SS type A sorting domain-containing protein [Fibrobacter sp.]|nr:T9SS type A sorting domain-containing protein [Fibrobacter sp.]